MIAAPKTFAIPAKSLPAVDRRKIRKTARGAGPSPEDEAPVPCRIDDTPEESGFPLGRWQKPIKPAGGVRPRVGRYGMKGSGKAAVLSAPPANAMHIARKARTAALWCRRRWLAK